MCGETGADSVKAVGEHACYMICGAGGIGEGEGDWEGDEVDIGDVGEELGAVESELTEVPEKVDVGV